MLAGGILTPAGLSGRDSIHSSSIDSSCTAVGTTQGHLSAFPTKAVATTAGGNNYIGALQVEGVNRAGAITWKICVG